MLYRLELQYGGRCGCWSTSNGAIIDLLVDRDYVMSKLTTVALVVITLYASHNDAADVPRLPDDAVIIVAADESWEDVDQDVVHFRGNIEIRTPGWTLMADRVTVYGKLEDAERIVAEGSPVHFIYSNSAANGDGHMEGEGLHLEYLSDSALLSLSGNAVLTG